MPEVQKHSVSYAMSVVTVDESGATRKAYSIPVGSLYIEYALNSIPSARVTLLPDNVDIAARVTSAFNNASLFNSTAAYATIHNLSTGDVVFYGRVLPPQVFSSGDSLEVTLGLDPPISLLNICSVSDAIAMDGAFDVTVPYALAMNPELSAQSILLNTESGVSDRERDVQTAAGAVVSSLEKTMSAGLDRKNYVVKRNDGLPFLLLDLGSMLSDAMDTLASALVTILGLQEQQENTDTTWRTVVYAYLARLRNVMDKLSFDGIYLNCLNQISVQQSICRVLTSPEFVANTTFYNLILELCRRFGLVYAPDPHDPESPGQVVGYTPLRVDDSTVVRIPLKNVLKLQDTPATHQTVVGAVKYVNPPYTPQILTNTVGQRSIPVVSWMPMSEVDRKSATDVIPLPLGHVKQVHIPDWVTNKRHKAPINTVDTDTDSYADPEELRSSLAVAWLRHAWDQESLARILYTVTLPAGYLLEDRRIKLGKSVYIEIGTGTDGFPIVLVGNVARMRVAAISTESGQATALDTLVLSHVRLAGDPNYIEHTPGIIVHPQDVDLDEKSRIAPPSPVDSAYVDPLNRENIDYEQYY